MYIVCISGTVRTYSYQCERVHVKANVFMMRTSTHVQCAYQVHINAYAKSKNVALHAYKHHQDITTSPSSSPPPPSVAIIATSLCGIVGPDGGEPRLALDLRRDRGGACSQTTAIIYNRIYSATWGQQLAPVFLGTNDIAPCSQILAPVSLETTFMEPFQNVG